MAAARARTVSEGSRRPSPAIQVDAWAASALIAVGSSNSCAPCCIELACIKPAPDDAPSLPPQPANAAATRLLIKRSWWSLIMILELKTSAHGKARASEPQRFADLRLSKVAVPYSALSVPLERELERVCLGRSRRLPARLRSGAIVTCTLGREDGVQSRGACPPGTVRKGQDL